MGHGHLAFSSLNWLEAGILIALVVALGLFLVRSYRSGERQDDGLTIDERRSLDGFERELLSVIRQYGDKTPQSRIIEEVAAGFETITETLQHLEAKGLVSRVWDPEAKELMVSA